MSKISRFTIIIISALLFASFYVQPCLAESNDIVEFADENLKTALIDAGVSSDADGNLTEAAMAALTDAADLSSSGICSLDGIQYLSNVQTLDISGNNITDMSILKSMTALSSVDISQNYLDTEDGGSDAADIQELEDSGITVINTGQKIPASSVEVSQNSVSMLAGETLNVTASVLPENASDKDVLWESADEAVATAAGGAITGVAPGNTVVTAKSADGFAQSEITVTVNTETLDCEGYTISGGYILGVEANTTPQSFFSKFSNDPNRLSLLNAEGARFGGQVLTTGTRLRLSVGGFVHQDAQIVVMGDCSSDGQIGITDYTLIRLQILGFKDMNDCCNAAADVNGDGQVNIADYTLIRLHILDIRDLYTGEINDPYAGIDIDTGYFDSFFNDSAIIGCSITDGLRIHTVRQRRSDPEFLGNLHFFTATSYNLNYALGYSTSRSIYYNGKKMLPQDALKAMGAKKAFLMIGMNDVFRSLSSNIEKYELLISRIQDKNPDIEIFVLGITPIVSSAQRSGFTNANVDAFNDALQDMCANAGVEFIEVSALKNGGSGLPSSYSSDKFVHLSTAGLEVYVDILRYTAKRLF